MAKEDTSNNAQGMYHYLRFTPEELAHLSPAELLQACLETRSLLQIMMGILSLYPQRESYRASSGV